jgi:hypothetical protein
MARTALLRPLALASIGFAVLSGCAVDVAPVAAPAPAPAAVAPAAQPPAGSGRSAPGGMRSGMQGGTQGGTRSGGTGPATGAMRAPSTGARTLDVDSVVDEIGRVTQEAVGVSPDGVSCPAEIPASAGTVVDCTAALEGQPLTYRITQTDDQGGLDIAFSRVVRVDAVEETLVSAIADDEGIAVTADCSGSAGHTVLVNAPGEQIACVAGTTTAPPRYAPVSVTVDEDGTLSYTVGTGQNT